MPPLTLPFVFAGVGLKTPAARLDANFQALAHWLNTHGAVVGLIATRPPPTTPGAIFVATDQFGLWYMADGTAWHPVGRAGDGTIDVDPDTGNVRAWGATVGAEARNALVLPLATGVPTTSPAGIAQLYLADAQGVAGRAAGHQRTEDNWVHALDRTLFRSAGNPLASISNLATEGSLWLVTVKGGTLTRSGLGGARPRGVELVLGLDTLNNSGSTRTLTLRMKFGGTGLTTVITLGSSGTRRKGTLSYRLDPVNPTFSAWTNQVFQWDAPPTQVLSGFSSSADPALDQPLEVTGQLSFAAATVDVRLFSATLSLC